MAHRWLRIRVDLVSGPQGALAPAPGRVMLVPPTATFQDLGLGIDLAFGRWDVTRGRSFRADPVGRHERRRTSAADTTIDPSRVVHESVARGVLFEYVFDHDAAWVHLCTVEDFVARSETQGLPPIAVPVLGWGTIPDQDGNSEHIEAALRKVPEDSAEATATAEAAAGATAEAATAEAEAGASAELSAAAEPRRRRSTTEPLDLRSVRAAVAADDARSLLEATDGRDLSSVLQQVGDGLTRVYRANGNDAPTQGQLAAALQGVESLLRARDWEGDDVLADEINAVLSGSERRGRTLNVDLADLADVMSSGGDEPGGYLHLDTGEVVHAFLHHDSEFEEGLEEGAELDNLWIYVDHDGDEAWQDMAAFAQAAPRDLTGILSVAVQGKGAFARFRRTVDELGLWSDWQAFSDDRRWGRARALLRSQGIRPV